MMFQDIIMAVFGILILIVLYLLFNVRATNLESKKEMEERLKELKAESRESQDKLNEASRQLQRKVVDRSKSQKAEIDGDRRNRMSAELENIATTHRSIKDEIANAEQTLSEETQDLESHEIVVEALENTRELEQQLRESRRRIAALQKESGEVKEYSKNRILVKPSEDFEQYDTIYFAELVQGGIVMYEIHGEDTSSRKISSTTEFTDHVAADSGSKHVMLFVRPSGYELFHELQRDFREADVPLGYQPIPEDKELAIIGSDFDPPETGGRNAGGDSSTPSTDKGTPDVSGADSDTDADSDAKAVAEAEQNPPVPEKPAPTPEEISEPSDEGPEPPTEEETEEKDWNWAMLLLLFLIILLLAMVILSKRFRKGNIR